MLKFGFAAVVGLMLLPQSADEPTRAWLAYAKRVAEDAPSSVRVIFDVPRDTTSRLTTSAVVDAFGRFGLTVRALTRALGRDTLVVRLTTVALDSTALGRRFYMFGVEQRRCENGLVQREFSIAHVRCPGLLSSDCALYFEDVLEGVGGGTFGPCG